MSANQKPKDYAEKYRILAGRTIFSDYTTRKAYMKQNQNFVNVTPYAPTRDVSILTILKEGEQNTTAAEYNSYIGRAQQSSTQISVPTAPTITSITSLNGAADVNFTAGDGPITNYEYSINNGTTFTAFSPVQITSPLSITGLTNGTTYQVKIRAVNSAGTGEPSNMLTVTPVTTPSAPTITTITAQNGGLSIAFTAGASGGSAITNYEYSTDNGINFTVRSPASITSPIIITGLINGTSYPVVIRAVNIVGSGTSSSAVNGTPAATTPDAPAITSIIPSSESLAVTFTAPVSDGGSSITNYEYSTNNGSSWTAVSPPSILPGLTITGLTNGTTYNVRVRAVNAVGSGTASSAVAATPSGVPGAPSLVMTLADDSAAYVYFNPGVNNGGTITNYEWSTDGINFTTASPADASSPVRVPGLTNGITYNIYLRAVNAAGTGPASTSLAVTPTSASVPASWLEYNPANPSSYSGTGTTVANVGSYGALSGTMSGVTYIAGTASGVFDFNGSANIAFSSFDFGNAFTISAWVYPRSKSSINGLVANTTANQQPSGFKVGWNFWTTTNRHLLFEGGNGVVGSSTGTANPAVIFNQWNHITYTFDRVNRRVLFFLNGIPVDFNWGGLTTNTVANFGVNQTWRIGMFMDGSYSMNAQLGVLSVYNSVLNAAQVAAEYNATKARFGL